MAQLNAANTSYPTTLDTASTLVDGVGGDTIVAAHQNGPATAIIALETELGTDPAGSATDVKTRLAVALNDAGAVTLGTAASTVGLLALTRGGLGQTIASTTNTADGYLLGFANAVLQPITLTSGSGMRVVATSGTWTIGLDSTAKISGDLVQRVVAASTTVATGTTVMNRDNTPALNTEGDQYLALSYLPRAVGNLVIITVDLYGARTAGNHMMALYDATSTSAVMASGDSNQAANFTAPMRLIYNTVTAAVVSQTYVVRAGPTAAGTFTLNGESGAGLFGNVLRSVIMLDEIQN